MANYINDSNMTYDLNAHRYTLTFEGFETLSGEKLEADHGLTREDAGRLLNRTTQIVYGYIYTWARNKERTEYEISLPKYRDTIKEALVEMMMGLLANKTDKTLYFGNLKPGNTVTPGVKQILRNGGLLFRGEWEYIPGYFELRGKEY